VRRKKEKTRVNDETMKIDKTEREQKTKSYISEIEREDGDDLLVYRASR
jgi:hypothetical protein